MHVLAIGSSVIDLFLAPDNNHYKIDGGKVSFDLGDKIPTEVKRLGLGGNGANVSVGLTRLEIPTTFYTYLGADVLSREIEEGLSREGVELIFEREKDHSSSFSIIFDFDHDRTIFSHHQKRNHIFKLDRLKDCDYIYLTSIGEYWEKAYEQIYSFATANKIPLAFSPGTHQLENINDTVKDIIGASKIYFSNKEEAEIVLNRARGTAEIKELLLGIHELGPEIVSVTDGESGAYACDSNGKAYHIKTLPDDGNEKTGAGDAYASGFFAAVVQEKAIPEAMLWGTLNAYSVMKDVGAQNGLLTKGALDKKLSEHNNLQADAVIPVYLNREKPVRFKFSPDLAQEKLHKNARTIKDKGGAGITLGNTSTGDDVKALLNEKDVHREETGGISGRPITPKALEVSHNLYDYIGEELPIHRIGGIRTVEDVWDALTYGGATTVDVYTAFVRQETSTPNFAYYILHDLAKAMRAEGMESMDDFKALRGKKVPFPKT